MARSIQAPGVEITEKDLTLNAVVPAGTNIFLAGFAPKGPSDEIVQITSTQEFESIYGAPTNPAERYFYYGAKQILDNSKGNLFVNRLPYGDGLGYGFGSTYGALVYPAKTIVESNTTVYRNNDLLASSVFSILSTSQVQILTSGSAFTLGEVNSLKANGVQTYTTFSTAKYDALIAAYNSNVLLTSQLITLSATLYPAKDTSVTNVLSGDTGTYVLGAPKFFELSKDEYTSLVDGSAFDSWSKTGGDYSDINSIADFAKAGMIVLNRSQTNINSRAEGYYIGLADNTNVEPNTDHNTIIKAYTNSLTASSTNGLVLGDMTELPETRLAFPLSATESGKNGSLSQSIESVAYAFSDVSTHKFDDTIALGVYKLRTSPYSPDTVKLDFLVEETYLGSLDSHRIINSQNGGPAKTFYIQNLAQNSPNVTLLVNDNISNRAGTTWVAGDGTTKKKVRFLTNTVKSQLIGSSTLFDKFGLHLSDIQNIQSNFGFADALFPMGGYASATITNKSMGSITGKLDRALVKMENDEIFDIDLLIEGGLGTIYATCCANQTNFFDDTQTTTALNEGLAAMAHNELQSVDADYKNLRDNYAAVFETFSNFATYRRKDCMFIADGLRQIFVKGLNSLTLSDPTKSFSQYIYNPLKHLFGTANTSYAAAYANWGKINDIHSGINIWIPMSPFVAADMANLDNPWDACAGYTRGRISNVLALAINPKQKEREQLYRISLNPIFFDPNNGFNIFGQKTLLKQPSAFDRINVRRLFLTLERSVKKTSKYFVFEPNTSFTRNRVVATLSPIFERAKNTQGLYDYKLICSNLNNTPQVIDSNELVVDIYIKPVRTAEFILVNFYATPTGADFNELVGR